MTRQRRTSQKIKPLEDLKIVHRRAAGLDIGAREIWACVPASRTLENVRVFGTFTVDLHALADWLAACGIETVAMEIYRRRIGFPSSSCSKHAASKSIWSTVGISSMCPAARATCWIVQWIQQLHSLGLLHASFRPDAEMSTLRAFLRHRAMLIEHRAPHVLHMQKALQQMNVQLPLVLSDIMGETGQKIIRAILAGGTGSVQDSATPSSQLQVPRRRDRQSPDGTWQPEHLFALKQSLEIVDFYTQQLAACDAELERQFAAVKPRWDVPPEIPLLPKTKPGSRSKNQPAYNVRAELFRITGVDLVAVEGISASLAQTILSEVGTEMSRFPTEKHFCSWLGLTPHHEISGGKILRNHTLKTDNRAGQAFRQAAACVIRSQSAFGAFYRRKKAQLGPMQALVATAHKIARTVYHLLKAKTPYHDLGAEKYEQQFREREVTQLRKTAAKLGFTLTTAAA